MRRFLNVTLFAVAALVVTYGLAQHYFARQVTERVVAELEKAYGGTVRLKDAQIGPTGTTLHGLELFEQDDPHGKPWLQVDKLRANVTLTDALRGTARPSELRLDKADVVLRFNQQGQLLTRWPVPANGSQGGSQLPSLVLNDSLLRFRREDGSELVLPHVNATVERDGDLMRLRGDFQADQWGRWTVAGTVQDGRVGVTFTSDGTVAVTQAMLRQLPFVPESVWHEVQVSGDTPAKVTLTYDPAQPALHFRVDLEPRHARLHIRAIDLDAEDVNGTVIIEDNLVRLRDVKGQVAGGRVDTEADLDFSGPITQLDFTQLKLDGLLVQRLPRSWNLPRQVEGQLDAAGVLRLEIDGGKVRTRGTGTGQLCNLRVAGLPLQEPVRLTLRDRSEERQEPATLLVETDVRDLDLADVLARLQARPAVEIAGKLAVSGQVILPLDTIADLASYRATATVEVTQGRVETVALDRFHTDVTLQQGKLQLRKLQANGPTLSVAGEVEAALAPAGEAQVDLTLRHLDFAALAKLLRMSEPLRGSGAGTVTARVPVERWDNLDAWRGNASLSVQQVNLGDFTLSKGTAQARLQDGKLTLSDARAEVAGTPVTASAQLELSKPYRFEGTLSLRQADLALLEKLPAAWRPPQSVSGRLSASADVAGTLQPWLLDTRGTAAIDDLRLLKLHAPRLTVRWHSTDDLLLLDDLDAALGQGKVQGSARLPLRGDVAGRVDLKLLGVDAAALSKDYFGTPPVALAGKVHGTVQATLYAEEQGVRRIRLAVDLPAASLKVERIPVEQLQGTLTWQQPLLTYHLDSHVAGGRLLLDGQLKTGEVVKGGGRLRLEKVKLGRLANAFRGESGLPALRGQLEIDLPYEHDGDGLPLGVGRFTVTRLRYGDSALGGDLRGDLQLLKEELLVREISGELAQGTLRGKLGWHYRQPQRRWFSVTLENAEAAKVLSPWPGVAAQVQGPVQLQMHGKLEREWHGSAEVRLHNGKVAGAEVSEWRLPLTWAFAPEQGRATFEARDSAAQVGGGRINAQATLTVDGVARLQGRLQFTNVDLNALFHSHADSGAVGGKVSGKFEFAAEDLRSANQLTGTLDATLAQTKSLDLPVFKQVLALVGVAPSATFQKGDIRARLVGDVIRIERLTLDSGVVQLFATGTITTRGQLGLDVTANTGRAGLTAGVLQQLGVPLAGELGGRPLALVRQLFSIRLMHLHVTGNVRTPTIQVQPLPALPQEALRFFIDGVLRLR